VKVILDTNVFVSGIFFTGPPHQILRAWRNGKITLVLSPEILEEYRRVAGTLAEQFPPIELGTMLAIVERESDFHIAPPLPAPVSDDSDDDKFLACAIASGTEIIISGDKHLLRVSGFQGIQVLKPRAFLDGYLGE
jgi:putative PIN family toxin of toxin-antitoxin system